MITGFNTDVPHQDRVYHVQTEDRGTKDNPVLESLVYIGGTIIAKKLTPYADKLSQGANEAAIATLLKKQHQVIIAAIKAGRIEDLVKHSARYSEERPAQVARAQEALSVAVHDAQAMRQAELKPALPMQQTEPQPALPMQEMKPEPPPKRKSGFLSPPATKGKSGFLSEPKRTGSLLNRAPGMEKPAVQTVAPPRPAKGNSGLLKTGSLNLDEVISDYLKRSSEQEKLDVKVIAPSVFIAGKTITLRIEVQQGDKVEPDAIVTVKIIGTAFKPQVFIGRAAADGVATFNLTLPAFSSGTAAIVIEVQSRFGRGELKHLIRRA
ncbi:MAG: hypothetical protein HY231_17280 [Acidobacteria bacterium]|nr:hypothetical protein [Acidobacteriota bacterium]